MVFSRLALTGCSIYSSILITFSKQSSKIAVRKLLSWHCCAFQRGNLILIDSEYVLNSSSYLSYSPAVHNWVQERVHENQSCNVIKGDPHWYGEFSKWLSNEHRYKNWKIGYQKQTVNIKYSHSRFFTFEHVYRVALNTLLLLRYLALMPPNNLKYL